MNFNGHDKNTLTTLDQFPPEIRHEIGWLFEPYPYLGLFQNPPGSGIRQSLNGWRLSSAKLGRTLGDAYMGGEPVGKPGDYRWNYVYFGTSLSDWGVGIYTAPENMTNAFLLKCRQKRVVDLDMNIESLIKRVQQLGTMEPRIDLASIRKLGSQECFRPDEHGVVREGTVTLKKGPEDLAEFRKSFTKGRIFHWDFGFTDTMLCNADSMNQRMVGCLEDGGLEYFENVFVLATSTLWGTDHIGIDLHPERFGWIGCYWYQGDLIAGNYPVVAHSFSEWLERILDTGDKAGPDGTSHYWDMAGFVDLGPAIPGSPHYQPHTGCETVKRHFEIRTPQDPNWPLGPYWDEIPKPRFLETAGGNLDLDAIYRFSAAMTDWTFSNFSILSSVQHQSKERRARAFAGHDKSRDQARQSANAVISEIAERGMLAHEEIREFYQGFLAWENRMYDTMKATECGFGDGEEPAASFWEQNGGYSSIVSGYFQACEILQKHRDSAP